MNVNRKTAGLLGGLVLLSSLIATAIFLLSGSQGVIYFAMVGTPLIVVIGVGAYVKGVIAQSGTSEEQFVSKRARAVAQNYQDTLRQLNDLKTTYPNWNSGVDAQVKSIAGDFDNQGVKFDKESGSFEISDSVKNSDIQEFERLSGEVTSLEENLQEDFTQFASSQLSEMNNVLRKLNEVNLIRSAETISTNPGNDLTEATNTIDDARNTCRNSIDTAIETVRNMSRGETRADDVESIDRELENANSFAQQNQFDSSLNSVLEARDKLRDQFSGSFEEKMDDIKNLIQAINQSNVEKYVDPDSVDELSSIEDSVSNVDSALELGELSQIERRARRVAEDMIASIEHELDKKATKLEQVDLPTGYYSKPNALEERYLSQLEETDSLEQFTQIWINGITDLTDELNIAQMKYSVVDAYDDVENTITEKLNSSGKVTAKDLPMKNADQFLGLYYRYEDGVELVQDGTVLRRGDVETYEINIQISYEKGSEEQRTATIVLDGGGYNKSKSITTRVAGSITFEEVPQGEITLSADPGDDEFGTITRNMMVNNDNEIDLSFSERGLEEQLCENIDADLEAVLSDMQGELNDLFAENGYLSTEMSLPIQDRYQPCLFAMWGKETGNSICRDGDDILIYDASNIRSQLENVLQYNAEPGEVLEYGQIRRNFLSAPLPDSVIKTEIMDLHSEHDLEPINGGIEVK